VRAAGGIADSQMVGDTEAAVKWMRAQPDHNGKVGLFGSCSGGRQGAIRRPPSPKPPVPPPYAT